jgi:hypothetical protein
MSLSRRSVHRPLAQVAGIIDSPVACRIDLDHVEIGRAVPNPETIFTVAAGVAGGVALRAVERHGEDASGCGLPYAAWPGEKVSVTHPAAGDGTA